MQTVKEIIEKIKNIDSLDLEDFSPFLSDERKGVQKALLSKKKQLLADKKEEERLENLLVYERSLYEKDFHYIAGIDEVGRGPLAGPVVAAAVILPKNCKIKHLDDSKKIPKSKHLDIYEQIKEKALAIEIAICDEKIIDEINIYQASKKAMREAVLKLKVSADYLLVDAITLDLGIPELSLIKGDAKSMTIAAASVFAKVTRDNIMQEYDKIYPGYDFEHNSGYGTKKHLEGLEKLGITEIHRKTFSPISSYLNDK
ncbi:MAG: ribonuclease HII [Lactovum sp.]